MKIYTKTGDKGQTSLIGGTRVPKYHLRIETYGTVDELNSWIGLLRDQPIEKEVVRILLEVQDRLFTIGSALAADPEKYNPENAKNNLMKLPELMPEDITVLEKEIDRMSSSLPQMKSFVLPGGHPVVSYCHIARCVCRRAERLAVNLNEENTVNPNILIYLNRLSDYLFMLARWLTSNFKAAETPWKPRF